MGLRRQPLAALALLTLLVASGGAAGASRHLAAGTGRRAPERALRARRSSASTTTSTLPGPGQSVFVEGGTVTVAVPSIPTQLNPSVPAGANRVTAMVTAQVWPQPFVVDPS
ncbi:MAG: hypothetical protein M0Z33_10770, partial [Actinomycetota bacterium]|nr:hypothetical protein [Actinomycetota bacterium]